MQKEKGYWNNIDNVRKEALLYKTKTEFKTLASKAWVKAKEFGIYEEVTAHMKRPPSTKIKYSIKELKTEALKYKTRKTFRASNVDMYRSAERRGYLNEICGHMQRLRKINGHWTYAKLHSEALKYVTRKEFELGSCGAYHTAYKRDLLDNVCSHMERGLYGFDKDKKAILYYLSINDGEAYKVGITNRTVEARFCVDDLFKIEVLQITCFDKGIDAWNAEKEILQKYKRYQYTGKPLLLNGNTELFIKDVLKGAEND